MNMKTLLRVLNLTAALFVAALLVVPVLTHDAPMGGWFGNERLAAMQVRGHNVPAWQDSYADRFEGCQAEKLATAGDLIVVDQDAAVKRLGFDVAWERANNDKWADDMWVVGFCR